MERNLVRNLLGVSAAVLGTLVVWKAWGRWVDQPVPEGGDSGGKATAEGGIRAHPRSDSHRPSTLRARAEPVEFTKEIAMHVAPSVSALQTTGGLKISRKLEEVLRLTPDEIREMEAAMEKAFASLAKLETERLEAKVDERGHPVWNVPPYQEAAAILFASLGDDLKAILGDGRGEFANISIQRSEFFKERGNNLRIEFIQYPVEGTVYPALRIRTGGWGQITMGRFFGKYQREDLVERYGHLIPDPDVVSQTFEQMGVALAAEPLPAEQ